MIDRPLTTAELLSVSDRIEHDPGIQGHIQHAIRLREVRAMFEAALRRMPRNQRRQITEEDFRAYLAARLGGGG